ncbi:MAG: TonB-dependent receptor, partial [Chitinophagaceae bacterium]
GASSGNTLILLDGIPLYDPSGISSEFDINYFNTNNIERIEILKGAQSTLYGSDAVAGVINFITKKNPLKKISGYGSFSGGSYGTVNAAAGLQGNINGWNYSAGYSFTHSDGFSSAADTTGNKHFENDGFQQHSLIASVGKEWNKKFSLRIFSLYNFYKADIDGSAFQDDKDYVLHNKNLQAGAEFKYIFKQNSLRFHYGLNKVERAYTDDSTDVPSFIKYQDADYKGYSHFAELYGNFFLQKNINLVAGLDYRYNFTKQHYRSISDFGPYETGLGDSAKTSQESVYASLIVKSIPRVTLEAGGRFNHHSIYGSNATYSFNPSYDFDAHWKLFINIASAYHVPSLYQLYGEYGNKNLQPEQTQNGEAGIQFTSLKTTARLTAFTRSTKNIIVFFTDPVTYAGKYLNAGTQYGKGFEAEINQVVTKNISITANYSFIDGKIKAASDFTGKDTSYFNLYRRPQHVLNFYINIEPAKKFAVSAGIQWASHSFEPVYQAAPIKLDGYYTLQASMNYVVNEKISLFADINNITNQKYEVVRGFNTKGFNFMAGIRMQF